MLQIHLSKALVKDLKAHVNDVAEIEPTALQWYGQKAVVDGSDCIILMELQSRYAMVFCGVTQYHLDHFIDVVQERMWREVCTIVQLEQDLSEEEMALLSDMILSLSQEQFYQAGHNRSVTTHINQVIEHLRDLVEYDGYELPVDMEQAMQFGFITNEYFRKRKQDKDYFIPLLVFRDFWMGLLDVLMVEGKTAGKKAKKRLNIDEDDADKVIHVDFINKKKM